MGTLATTLLEALLVFQRGVGAALIPLLSALALGAQRLLPALQQIYRSWALSKGYNAEILAVLAVLHQLLPSVMAVPEPLSLRECIRLEGVTFRYWPDQPKELLGVDLVVCCGEHIGLIVTTGSGKSTTVDGEDLHDLAHPERLAAWRAAIAHVP